MIPRKDISYKSNFFIPSYYSLLRSRFLRKCDSPKTTAKEANRTRVERLKLYQPAGRKSHRYDKISLLAQAILRNKGVKRWVKTNNDNNFWVNSTLQNGVIEKIIFPKLQGTACVRYVGGPLFGALIWRHQ